MKLYLKAYSSFVDNGEVDIKKELKQKYKLETRRQDKFIHLAVYGAQLLKQKIEIRNDDELYITSGIGDVDIVQKTNTYMYKDNQPLKLFDFINLLGNTTSYYVAKSLSLRGKNIFQISDNDTFKNTLISAYSSALNSKKDVIIGSVDLVSEPSEVIKRVLGVKKSIKVLSSVNFQKFSLDSKDAIAEVEFELDNKSTYKDKPFETYDSYLLNCAVEDKKRVIKIESLK
jgi:hypothetical protein